MTALEQILSNVETIIKHKRKDSVWNHLLTFIERDYNYSSCITENGFTIWKYSSWNGIFYSMIVGKIVEKEGQKKIIFSTKLNKLAKSLIIIFFLWMSFIVLDSAISYKQAYDGSHYFWEIKWNEIFTSALSAIVFSSVMLPVLYFVRSFEKRDEIQELKERLRAYSNSTHQDYF